MEDGIFWRWKLEDNLVLDYRPGGGICGKKVLVPTVMINYASILFG